MIRRKASSPVLRASAITADPQLFERLAAGEIAALGEVYDRYHEPVRRFVARATADAEDVDDLVQATFLAAAKSAAQYDGRASCRPWLIGIAVQLLRRRRQVFARLRKMLTSWSGARTASIDPRPALQAQCDVERALLRISEPKRISFLMVEVERLSCAEAATLLDVPIGTVWTRIHAARRELRMILEGDEP